MRCLIVLAHPLDKSLNHRFADLAAQTLAAAGHDVARIDLYAEDFDPRLTRAERETHYTETPDHSGIAPHAAALREADMLVLVFPTWWFGLPAILKGWIDRVFAPGIAFDHGTDFGPIVPKLDRLRRMVAITTLGTPWWADRLVMWRPVRRMLKTAVLGSCASQARFSYFPFYAAEKPTAARIDAFEKRVRAALTR